MVSMRLAIWFGVLASTLAVADRLAAAQFTPNIGHDAATPELRSDPRLIVDARVPPYAAVGRLTGAMVCTGVLVLDPRIVLTAAHCVVERNGQAIVSDLTFEPGYQFGAALGSFSGEVWAIGSMHQFTQITMHDAANDWAIVVLDRPAAPSVPLGIRSLGRPADLPSAGTVLSLAYGDDLAHGGALAADPACSIARIAWEILLHDCVVSRGGSGAPLLVKDGGSLAVVGINTGRITYASRKDGHAVRRNGAVSASFFAAALDDVRDRIVDGRGRGCRYEWVRMKAPAGAAEPRFC